MAADGVLPEQGREAIGLPLAPESTRKARRWIETKLGGRLAGGKLDDARLVVTELVTNAILHAHGRFLKVEINDLSSAVEIAVVDEGGKVPELRDRGPWRLTGRGLRIVDALAEDWGTVAVRSGKRVWARLSV